MEQEEQEEQLAAVAARVAQLQVGPGGSMRRNCLSDMLCTVAAAAAAT